MFLPLTIVLMEAPPSSAGPVSARRDRANGSCERPPRSNLPGPSIAPAILPEGRVAGPVGLPLASDRDGRDADRARLQEHLRACCQGRPGRDHVVDEQDPAPGD